MNRWGSLSGPLRDAILFQLPISHVIALCKTEILPCTDDITNFDDKSSFWQQHPQYDLYDYLAHQFKKDRYRVNINQDIAYEAARLGNMRALKRALQSDDFKDDQSKINVMYYAADGGQPDIIRFLFENMKVPPAQRELNYLLLHGAEHGHPEVVNLLLELGADPSFEQGRALKMAVGHGHPEVAILLLERGRFQPLIENTVFLYSAGKGYTDIIHFLLDKKGPSRTPAQFGLTQDEIKANRWKYNDWFNTKKDSLQVAAKNGYIDIVSLILDEKDIPDGKEIVLVEGAENGHLDIVRLALDRGADIRTGEDRRIPDLALVLASENGHLDVVQSLLDAPEDYDLEKIDINDWNEQAAFEAANGSHKEIVQLFIDRGIDVRKFIPSRCRKEHYY